VEADIVLLLDHKGIEAGETDLRAGKASCHHEEDQQPVTLVDSGQHDLDLLVQDMCFCHLENSHPLEPVDSSLGLDHPVGDIGCAGALVRRPF
jgi:hypothetical protein